MSIIKTFSYFVLLLLFACSVHEPKLPEWDTEWRIYAPTQDFIMGEEIINDSTFIAGYANDSIPIILFNLKDSTDWERIEPSDLVLDPQTDHFSASIGDIELGDYDDLYSDSTRLPEILPDSLFIIGDTLLPPFDTLTVSPPEDSLQFSQYEYATIAQGELWITFCNETFLDLREGVKARIYNENDISQYVGEIEFTEPIPAHTSMQSDPLSINNRTIYNIFRIEYIIPLEENPTPRYVSEEDRNGYFCTILSVGDLIATEARAKVPEQTAHDSAAVAMREEDHKIISGTIESGTIQFDIQNMLPVNCDVTVSLLNFRENGLVKTFSRRITGGNEIITEDISGLEIINHRNPGSIIDSLDYIATVKSDATEDYTYFSSEDSVIVDVTTNSIQMASVTGILDTVDFNIDPVELDEIDVFEDIDGQLRLNDLEMQLTFENELDILINADLSIISSRSDGQYSPVIINYPIQIEPSSESPITRDTLDANSTDPSIVDLLAILPDNISIEGNATVSGNGSVSVGDGLRVQYIVSSPLTIQIDEALTFKSTEIDSITYDDLDEDQRDQIVNDLADVSAKFNFINHIPVGGSFKYYMAIDSMELYSPNITDPSTKIVIDADIDPAVKGPDNYAQSSVVSHSDQQFTDEQLDIFNYPTIYTRQEITILNTDGEVKIRQDDSIEIEAILDFKVTVNSESD